MKISSDSVRPSHNFWDFAMIFPVVTNQWRKQACIDLILANLSHFWKSNIFLRVVHLMSMRRQLQNKNKRG